MKSLIKIAPVVFVFLWSTGFIGSKLGAPYADPMVFLSIRFMAVLPILAAICWWANIRWPRETSQILHCIFIGALVHGIYLGGVFWAIDEGMPAGASAIVVGLQPVLSAVTAAFLLKERIEFKHWIGLAIGGFGLFLVLGPKIAVTGSGISPTTVFAVFVAVLAISIGTVYQKRFVPNTDLLAATFWQYIGAIAVTLPLSLFESWQVTWSGQFIFAIAWLVLVLSIGAILLLMFLIRQGAVSQVASLFYLVPVATSIESYFLFGETLSVLQLAGMALVVAAVLLIRIRFRRIPA